jgi:hypothetical protein
MTELIHLLQHCTGFCGENHPSVLTFILGHTEIGNSINFLKLRYGQVCPICFKSIFNCKGHKL